MPTPTHPISVDVPDGETVRNSSFRSVPVRLLRWIERRYLELAFRGLRHATKAEEDAWWFAFGNDAVGPCRLDDIFDSVLDGCSPAGIVHVSKAGDVPAPWQTISYRAWWSNPATARVWTVGFWLGCFVFGWFFVCLATPLGGQGPAQLAYLLAVTAIVINRRRMAMSSTRLWKAAFAKSWTDRPAGRDDAANCWMPGARPTSALR
jgi:hypothetical protein